MIRRRNNKLTHTIMQEKKRKKKYKTTSETQEAHITVFSILGLAGLQAWNAAQKVQSVAEASYLCLEAHPMLKHLLVVHGDPQILRVIH